MSLVNTSAIMPDSSSITITQYSPSRCRGICTFIRFQPPNRLKSMIRQKAVASSASSAPARSSLPKGAPKAPMA